jgi:hypothetical protein
VLAGLGALAALVVNVYRIAEGVVDVRGGAALVPHGQWQGFTEGVITPALSPLLTQRSRYVANTLSSPKFSPE